MLLSTLDQFCFQTLCSVPNEQIIPPSMNSALNLAVCALLTLNLYCPKYSTVEISLNATCFEWPNFVFRDYISCLFYGQPVECSTQLILGNFLQSWQYMMADILSTFFIYQSINHQFTWYSTAKYDTWMSFSHALYIYSCTGHFYTVSFHCLEEEPPPPDQLPGEHTGPPSYTWQCLFLLFGLSVQHSLNSHSLQIEVWLGMLQQTTFSFMCTSHIDMTAHNSAFLWVG